MADDQNPYELNSRISERKQGTDERGAEFSVADGRSQEKAEALRAHEIIQNITRMTNGAGEFGRNFLNKMGLKLEFLSEATHQLAEVINAGLPKEFFLNTSGIGNAEAIKNFKELVAKVEILFSNMDLQRRSVENSKNNITNRNPFGNFGELMQQVSQMRPEIQAGLQSMINLEATEVAKMISFSEEKGIPSSVNTDSRKFGIAERISSYVKSGAEKMQNLFAKMGEKTQMDSILFESKALFEALFKSMGTAFSDINVDAEKHFSTFGATEIGGVKKEMLMPIIKLYASVDAVAGSLAETFVIKSETLDPESATIYAAFLRVEQVKEMMATAIKSIVESMKALGKGEEVYQATAATEGGQNFDQQANIENIESVREKYLQTLAETTAREIADWAKIGMAALIGRGGLRMFGGENQEAKIQQMYIESKEFMMKLLFDKSGSFRIESGFLELSAKIREIGAEISPAMLEKKFGERFKDLRKVFANSLNFAQVPVEK